MKILMKGLMEVGLRNGKLEVGWRLIRERLGGKSGGLLLTQPALGA